MWTGDALLPLLPLLRLLLHLLLSRLLPLSSSVMPIPSASTFYPPTMPPAPARALHQAHLQHTCNTLVTLL
jgi:hypothetical protein